MRVGGALCRLSVEVWQRPGNGLLSLPAYRRAALSLLGSGARASAFLARRTVNELTSMAAARCRLAASSRPPGRTRP